MFKFRIELTIGALLIFGLFASTAYAQENENGMGATDDSPAATMESESSSHVVRALFTSNVQNREPTDTLTSLSNDTNKIYFYSELSDMGGQTVTHRWEYQGKTMAEITFNVGGPRWRIWSSKTLLPQWTGDWRVTIIDGAGNEIGSGTFNYMETTQPQN